MNKKKLQILNAARELFLESGFSNTSIADIITLANVSKGTFYNHFTSKNACMIAILQEIHERTVAERKVIAFYHETNNIETLKMELLAHYSIVLESNIMDMMMSNINHQEDQDILDALKEKSLFEMNWLAERLVQIYGRQIEAYSYDYAAFIIGHIQHLFYIRLLLNLVEINLVEIIEHTLKIMDPAVNSIQTSEKGLLKSDYFKHESTETLNIKFSGVEIVQELQQFFDNHELQFSGKNREYTLFLIENLTNTPERKNIIEAVAYSFIKSFNEKELMSEAFEIFIELLRFVQE